MQHLDDGKLNALLDGELEAAEAAAVQAHVAACPECTARLEEARRFLAQAADLLGALEVPPAQSAATAVPVAAAPAPPPPRRVSQTKKEVALDLDGATHKSPALPAGPLGPPPAFPAEAPAREPRALFSRPTMRRRLDLSTLTWAATVILALGVGYLTNEVRHTRRDLALEQGDGTAGKSGGVAGAAAAPAAPLPATNGKRPAAAKTPSRTLRSPARQAAQPNATTLAQKAAPGGAHGKRLAQPGAVAATGEGPSRAAETQLVAGVARAQAEPLPAAGAGAPQRSDAPAPLADAGRVAFGAPLTTFRTTTLEDAVARLGGSIRLVDGLRIERVEVGPGYRVPGADRTRDLIRILYRDGGGQALQLDEQRLTPAAADTLPAAEAAREEAGMVGLRFGDTLTTAAPNAQVRVRWLDNGGFWLSLTAALPPDSLRKVAARVR